MQLGLWPCATASCSSGPLTGRWTVTTSQQHACLPNPKQLEWNNIPMPDFQIRKSKSMCKRAEEGSDGIQSPQRRHRGGTLETLSKSQSVRKAGEPLHISWEHADTVFGMSWLEQILWYQGWEAGRRQVGKVPPLHLYSFLSSSSVTVCPHVSRRVTGCLQPEEVSSMGRQPAALPAEKGQTFPWSTSMRFLPLCTWPPKQRL